MTYSLQNWQERILKEEKNTVQDIIEKMERKKGDFVQNKKSRKSEEQT